MNKTSASPNIMVCQFFHALRRLCCAIEQYQDHDTETIQQDAALGVISAVTGVEIFMNIYFRVLVDKVPYLHAAPCILDDLKNRASLEKKIKKWPAKVFGKELDFGKGIGQRFMTLKTLRNKLVHFSSSHETIEVDRIRIEGMADIRIYSQLDAHSAKSALDVAEQFICEIFRLRGISEQDSPHALHGWTGKVPDQ